MDISKQNIGNAGEYYLASILSASNFVVTITLGRNERYDLLAVNPKGKTLKISVKARNLEETSDFPLSQKDEAMEGVDFFYAFIRLNGFKKEPDFWVVPSKIVAEIVKESHRKWLGGKGKRVEQRKDTPMRLFYTKLTTTSKEILPENWENEVAKYYKNIEQLQNV